MNVIAAVSWVPKGAASSVPKVAVPPSQEGIQEMIKNNGDLEISEQVVENMDLATDEVSQTLAAAYALGRSTQNKRSDAEFDDIADDMKQLHMHDYDNEDEGIQVFGSGLDNRFYPSNDADPFLKDKDDDVDSEELHDVTIQPTDAVIVCARTKDHLSQLEIWVYEDNSNMYVHHHVNLSAPALCTAWLDLPPKGEGLTGNFVAVGSMQSSIEIWDLDTVNEDLPALVLGSNIKKTRRKKESIENDVQGGHTGPVLGLSWNKDIRNALASASADKLVKIWDIDQGKCDITMDHHTDKVQSVAWNHPEPVLLSGSFDGSVVMIDVRIPKCPALKWTVGADVESLAWDPHKNHSFAVSLEDGTVQGFDVRSVKSDSKLIFTLHAHDEAVCCISYNPSVPNLLATGSADKKVKLWNLSDSTKPSCIASHDPKTGGVFSVCFSGDNPFLLAIGGSNGQLKVWNTSSEAGVARIVGNCGAQT